MSAAPVVSEELQAFERANRKARPWLYTGADTGGSDPAASVVTDRRIVGIPIAVKLGVAIGKARRRDQLAAARAHAAAAFDHGLIESDVYDALNAEADAKTAELAAWRGYWANVAPPRLLARVTDAQRRPRIRHRRRLSLAGPLPPELGQHFTEGQRAVLKIIADEVWRSGTCRLSTKEMCDRSQASETLLHQATRKAARLGLINVKYRKVPGRKSLNNLIMVVDTDWLRWIYHPKFRSIREDREVEAEARQKALILQGAQRCTPQTVTYIKNAEGAWNGVEVGELTPIWRPPDP